MDDLISRQAAIDAILAIKDYGNSDRANALGLAECAVTTLPSVQPEQIARDIATIIENEKDMRVLNAPSAQPEIIFEDVKKYCEKRHLVILTREFYDEMKKTLQSVQPEIIRCKDCKYFDPLTEDFDYNFCDAWAGGTNEDMFCGFAERRQE